MANKIIPPIKYYGGKFYMADTIKDNFPKQFNIYVEGFGGSASVLFSKPQSGLEVYNDLGQNVWSLYSVIHDPDLYLELKSKLELTPYSAQMREKFKEELKSDDLSLLERAYRYIFVNRTSFGGNGGFSTNLTLRRNMTKSTSDYLSMIDRLPEIHQRLSTVIIEHRDIIDLIHKYDNPDTFFYLDPPYVWDTRSSTTSYEVEMSNDQHQEFIDTILNSQGMFLISGYANPIYNQLEQAGFVRIDFKSPNTGSDRTESLWRNYTETGYETTTNIEEFF